MKTKKIKVSAVQTRPVFGDVKGNVDKACLRLNRLTSEVVVLPELFSTGYQFKNRAEALELGEDVKTSYAIKKLCEVSKDKGVVISAGFAERAGKKVYNSAVLIANGKIKDVYRKAHLFWNEKNIFDKGNTKFSVHKIKLKSDEKGRLSRPFDIMVSQMICFDWYFPEVMRKISLMGADIVLHPSNLVLPNCPEAMKVRSLENRVYSVTANRIGTEKRIKNSKLTFIGKSQVVDPMGRVLKRAGTNKEETVTAEIDIMKARDKKATPLNDLFKDRRVEFYKY